MHKKLVALICGFTLLSAPAMAQAACDAAKLSSLVDVYASAPFSARTWRVLNGLGDPMIEPSSDSSNVWQNQDDWKKLVTEILPAGQAPQDVGYDCRIAYPLEVLQARVAVLGTQSAYVRQWVHAQEKVLQVCSTPDMADAALPAAIEIHPALAAMQNEDRAYQEASIAFYRDKPKAIELFRAIAATGSPHKAAARYNIANLLAEAKNVTEARTEANGILSDPTLSSVHGITKELLGFIANIEDTPAGWTALIDDAIKTATAPTKDILASQTSQNDYARALNDIDYAGIRAKRDDWWLKGTLPADATISKAIYDASRTSPMALWMMAGQSAQDSYDQAPWTLVGSKWQGRMTGYLDQVMAVTPSAGQIPALPKDVLDSLRAKPDDATREGLWTKVHTAMAAAQQSCGDAPETAALGVYIPQAVRLSVATGHFEQAYDELSKLPIKSSALYQNTVLQKLSEYILGQGLAEEGRHMRDRLLTPEFFASLPEGLKTKVTDSSAEFMGWVAEDEAHWKAALAMSSQKSANLLLNFLPTKSLWSLSEDPMFSSDEKALLARVAWTREYASGATPDADKTAKLYAANPQLKDAANQVAAAFPTLNPERQRLLTILRNPRFGILVGAPGLWSPLETVGDSFTDLTSGDHNDRNWWCPLEPDRQLGGLRDAYNNASGVLAVDQYSKSSLTPVYDQALRDSLDAKREALLKQQPVLKTVNWKEISALSKMPGAPKLLSEAAIRWGKASKGDDGAPEALALAVRVTHYGCNWHGRHRAYSKPAQQLLAARFPDTSWARQTPYWFDCERTEWDKTYNKVAVCDAKTWPKQALPK